MNDQAMKPAKGIAMRTRVLAVATLTAAVAAGYGWWASSVREAPAASADAAETAVPSPAADGSVVLSAAQLRAQGIDTAAIQSAEVLTVDGLPAQAMAPLSASAQVVAPYAGVVTRILADEGALVRQGQALARIQSQEVLAAQAELARARIDAHASSLQAWRDAALLADGIIPAARNEQSQARAAAAQSVLSQAQGALARLRPVQGGQAGEYELLAPMTGQVVRRHLMPGQAVAALDAAFMVAEPGQIDVQFSAPLRLRADLRPGLEVRLPDGALAHVVAVGADADAASQSLRVRARMQADPAGVALPYAAGQQFSVRLLLPAPEGTFSVPTSALLPAGAQHVLFVAEPPPQGEAGILRIRSVAVQQLGSSESMSAVRMVTKAGAEAAPALAADMQVVTRGTALLKSMIPAQ